MLSGMRSLHALAVFALLAAACSDTTPPSWPTTAVLEAEPEATQIRVTWPDPIDDDVLVFAVSVNGEERTRATTSTHTVTVGELEDETAYAVEVVAIDHDDNASAPLTASVVTLDGTPPEWPEGAELTATSPDPKDAEERRVDLAWPIARDATVYRVSREAVEVGRVQVASDQVDAAPLAADTTFEVRAIDAAGNESEPLTIDWGETEQAEREAEEDAVAENGEGEGDGDDERRPPPAGESRLVGLLTAESASGTLEDVLAGGATGGGTMDGTGIRGVGSSDDPN